MFTFDFEMADNEYLWLTKLESGKVFQCYLSGTFIRGKKKTTLFKCIGGWAGAGGVMHDWSE